MGIIRYQRKIFDILPKKDFSVLLFTILKIKTKCVNHKQKGFVTGRNITFDKCSVSEINISDNK